MNITEAELPDDILQLKLMIIDLNRRLQNTQYILQSEKQIKEQLFQQNEYYKYQMKVLLQSFSLEFSRIKQLEIKHLQEKELESYEKKKLMNTKNVENLRMLELDNQMSGRTRYVPKNIVKLRNQIVEVEKQQENQKRILSYLTNFQEVNEKLIHSIQQNNISEVMNCLQQGADINYVDSIGYLPVHYAIIYGFYDIVQFLLMKGADFSTYLTGFSSLVFACQYGHVSILSLLLSYGGNINEKDKNGLSPIMMALLTYHFQVMEFCVLQGAEILDYDLSTENSLLHMIVLISSSNYHNKYLTNQNNDGKNNNKAESGALKTTATQRMHPSSHNSSSGPVINEVILSQIIHFLIENGCDLYRVNKENMNPYQLALARGNRTCLDILKPFYEGKNILQQTKMMTFNEEKNQNNNPLMFSGENSMKESEKEESEQKHLQKTGARAMQSINKSASTSKLQQPPLPMTTSKGLSSTKNSQSQKVLPLKSNQKVKGDNNTRQTFSNNNNDNHLSSNLSENSSLERPSTAELQQDNLAIPPPTSSDHNTSNNNIHKGYSSKNLLEKINEHWTFQEETIPVVAPSQMLAKSRHPPNHNNNNNHNNAQNDLLSVASSVTFD
jgi:ankyrin repeat protein